MVRALPRIEIRSFLCPFKENTVNTFIFCENRIKLPQLKEIFKMLNTRLFTAIHIPEPPFVNAISR